MTGTAAVLLAALLLDAALGEPPWLWRRLAHPVVLMGRLIAAIERRANRGTRRRLRGALALALPLGGLCLAAAALAALPGGWLLGILAGAILIAQRSLVQHVAAVAAGLEQDTGAGRAAVALIVGRDTAAMDEAAIARAAIESAAENFSDGVVAPAFWLLVGGLPGLVGYKFVNTADSMIGHRSARYRDYGWAAARLDDLLNLVPARLSAVILWLARPRRGAWRIILADAPRHRSPNAGWPEAAMAAALHVALAGPRSYDGTLRDFPFVGAAGRHRIGAAEVRAAVAMLWRGWTVLCIAAALVWLLTAL